MNASKRSAALRKSDRYCVLALACLVLALLSLGVGVFLGKPTSVSGVIFLCIGILLMFGCITCFALYNHAASKEPKRFS